MRDANTIAKACPYKYTLLNLENILEISLSFSNISNDYQFCLAVSAGKVLSHFHFSDLNNFDLKTLLQQ